MSGGKKYFLRQRRKPSVDMTTTQPASSDDHQALEHLRAARVESESEDGFVSPATKAKVEKAVYATARKRMQTRQQTVTTTTTSDAPELPSPRLDTLSFNMFRAAQGNEAVEDMLLFREQPRQVFVLFCMVLAVSYYSYTHDSDDMVVNVRTGFFAGVLIFLVYCFLQTRDSLMVRPHPGLWRVVHGCSVIYLLLLAALSVQNRAGGITSMQFFFPEVGATKKLTPKGAKLECEINGESIYRGVSSIWFLAHVTGWWGKMCMFRDWRFCWVLSIAFEILELALQFVIPDFQECWWDSLFMDLFGANLVGMALGHLTLKLFSTKSYDWSGKKEEKMGTLRFALSQFTPISWSQYHWEVFSSFKRFVQVVFALIVCLQAELNAFFLINTLTIPKESNFNAYRLSLMFLVGIQASAEYYEFLSNPDCWRLGQNAWMMLSISIFEVLVWLKFSHGVLFQDPPPAHVLYPILSFVIMFGIWMVLFFTQKRPRPTRVKRSGSRTSNGEEIVTWGKLDVLFWVSFTPLLLLTSQWAY
ncbi:hypothetical protein Poli38472_007141 [Pythium oligandrum]|uniref:Phosphatidylserine synthase n=1 Tax=Pythium oligandrum TaxID=41045 RepID=A0A8K1FE31_PYTOL|nr:hypothetical protein Poli38472_007141 [Pythium oligandrum]|eukprot:TMW58996.1 hypothetical protein Poli38472_007141 [Pythium oligandrum]